MLNLISDVTAAADTRTVDCQLATGAFLPGRVDAARQCPGGVPMFARLRGTTDASILGLRRKAAVHWLPQGQQYSTMTRSAAATGGALGPHPARDPV